MAELSTISSPPDSQAPADLGARPGPEANVPTENLAVRVSARLEVLNRQAKEAGELLASVRTAEERTLNLLDSLVGVLRESREHLTSEEDEPGASEERAVALAAAPAGGRQGERDDIQAGLGAALPDWLTEPDPVPAEVLKPAPDVAPLLDAALAEAWRLVDVPPPALSTAALQAVPLRGGTGLDAAAQAAPEVTEEEDGPRLSSRPEPDVARQPQGAAAPPGTFIETEGRPGQEILRPLLAVAAALVLGVAGAAVWHLLTPEQPAAPVVRTPPPPPPPVPAGPLTGRVEDRASRRPIAGAKIFHASELATSDQHGRFRISRTEPGQRILVRAPGYRPLALPAEASRAEPVIPLEPLEIRAIFLGHDVLARTTWDEQVSLVRRTGSNAVVLAIKEDWGNLNIPVDHPVARQIKALERVAIPNPGETAARWRAAGIYTICLVAAFKDNLLATSIPEAAIRSRRSKQMIRDAAGVAWADPASPLVQDYILSVVRTAAAAGFDEVDFDFIRFPAEPLSQEGLDAREEQRRLEVIAGFLRRAAQVVAPYNVALGASMFGLTCGTRRGGVIGQRIEEFAAAVDYLAPMLYPSSFRRPGAPAGAVNPYRIVQQNLAAAAARLGGHRERLRPWLQGFGDPPADGRPADVRLIREQVRAARETAVSGWMLWNHKGRYEPAVEALGPRELAAAPRSAGAF